MSRNGFVMAWAALLDVWSDNVGHERLQDMGVLLELVKIVELGIRLTGFEL